MRRPVALDGAVLGDPRPQCSKVEPSLVVDAAGEIRDGDDRRPFVAQLLRGNAADVAEPLHDAAEACELPAELRAGALDHHHDTRAGRLTPEDRAADRDRLPRDDLGHGVALLHGVRVHDPGHRLLVRRHVRRRHVLLRSDDQHELGGEPPRQALDLARRHAPRLAPGAALRAAVGETEERALPSHPHGERGALAERDVRVVADAALRRA